MKAHYLGHVVFYVKDLERSLTFYRDLLGVDESVWRNDPAAVLARIKPLRL